MLKSSEEFLKALREEIDARIKDDRSIENAVELIALTENTESTLRNFIFSIQSGSL